MGYLALQYAWAAGVGYSQYGFVLFACTLVPLQGFWNSVVFFRIRAKKKVGEAVSEVKSRSSLLAASRLSRYSSQQRSSYVTPNAGDGSLFDAQIEKTKSAVRFSDTALGGINEGDGKDPEEMGVADTALGGINEGDGKAPEEMEVVESGKKVGAESNVSCHQADPGESTAREEREFSHVGSSIRCLG